MTNFLAKFRHSNFFFCIHTYARHTHTLFYGKKRKGKMTSATDDFDDPRVRTLAKLIPLSYLLANRDHDSAAHDAALKLLRPLVPEMVDVLLDPPPFRSLIDKGWVLLKYCAVLFRHVDHFEHLRPQAVYAAMVCLNRFADSPYVCARIFEFLNATGTKDLFCSDDVDHASASVSASASASPPASAPTLPPFFPTLLAVWFHQQGGMAVSAKALQGTVPVPTHMEMLFASKEKSIRQRLEQHSVVWSEETIAQQVRKDVVLEQTHRDKYAQEVVEHCMAHLGFPTGLTPKPDMSIRPFDKVWRERDEKAYLTPHLKPELTRESFRNFPQGCFVDADVDPARAPLHYVGLLFRFLQIRPSHVTARALSCLLPLFPFFAHTITGSRADAMRSALETCAVLFATYCLECKEFQVAEAAAVMDLIAAAMSRL